jgi:hypothetical protein
MGTSGRERGRVGKGKTYVEARLECLRLGHGALLEVHLGVPGLHHEPQTELTSGVFLKCFLFSMSTRSMIASRATGEKMKGFERRG